MSGYRLLIGFILMAFLVGCVETPPTEPSNDGADDLNTAQLFLTHGPDAVLVTFSDITATYSGGGASVSLNTAATFDLIDLSGLEAFLSSAALPAGQVNQFQLTIATASIVIDGDTFPVAIQGNNTVRLSAGFTAHAGCTTDLTLAFDADKSLSENKKHGWRLKANLDLVETSSTCNQLVPCTDEAPANATSIEEDVEVLCSDTGCTDPTACEWACDTGFDLIDGACINTQTVACTDDAPANATSTEADVEITFTGTEWTEPATCDWTCDAAFDLVDGSCINTQTVACTDEAPANATSIEEDVEITFTGTEWTEPAACAWTCDAGFDQLGDACTNTQTVACTDDSPANGTPILEDVEIIFTGTEWTEPTACDWICDADYHQTGDICVAGPDPSEDFFAWLDFNYAPIWLQPFNEEAGATETSGLAGPNGEATNVTFGEPGLIDDFFYTSALFNESRIVYPGDAVTDRMHQAAGGTIIFWARADEGIDNEANVILATNEGASVNVGIAIFFEDRYDLDAGWSKNLRVILSRGVHDSPVYNNRDYGLQAGGVFSPNDVVIPGQIQMFAVSHSGTDDMKLYVDGVEVVSVAKSQNHSSTISTTDPTVGALRPSDILVPHKGGLQGLTFIPSVLTATEVSEIYTNSGGPF